MGFPFRGTKYWLGEFGLTRYKIKLENGLYGTLPILYPSKESQVNQEGFSLQLPSEKRCTPLSSQKDLKLWKSIPGILEWALVII